MSEAIYDEKIAPALLRLCKECAEYGMPFTATVEFEPGHRETTASGISPENLNMWIVYLAGRLGARLDDLVVSVARQVISQKIPHTSVVLERLGVAPGPVKVRS